MLVEFASVVDAVACAVKVQRSMVGRNADVPEDKQIIFRIGINIGDIIIDGDDIFGDGVNIAARLERCANPAASASRGRPTTRSGTSSRWLSQTSASKP